MNLTVRFSSLVRHGLRFRNRFEEAKRSLSATGIPWYPYDSFVNLFFLQSLLKEASLSLAEVIGGDPILDLGAGDGALSFFFESLGHQVHAVDYSGSNMNRMQGLRQLAQCLGSQVQIEDVDIDGRFELSGAYGLSLFLGTLYHLKNPYYALEKLSAHTRYCFLGTRVARLGTDRQTRLDTMPLAYLVDAGEVNGDETNYWIFSPCGIQRLVKRTGWTVCGWATSGPTNSDPTSAEGDERMFLLLRCGRRGKADPICPRP
jgi:tRNA (mo5U34)-methyltransferase